MASTNGNNNLVDLLEEAFQACVHSLTKEEASTGPEKDEVRLEVEQTMKFIDLARQMETFFIQKRFLLSSLKPELLLKEENVDLRHEISRKDELIRKHFEKIERWKQLLADQPTFNKPNIPQGPQQGSPQISGMPQMQQGMSMGVPNMPPQHLQQQQMMQQQQQQMQMQANNPQQMFIPQSVGNMGSQMGMGGPPRPPFGQGVVGNQNIGPLAYLEKTTNNIDLGDGRR